MRHHLFALAATLVLTSSLASAGSKAAPNSAAKAEPNAAVALVTDRVVQPLVAKDRERSKFSRARLPPSERRVRLLDDKPQQDSKGDTFVTFAIDSRHGWGSGGDDDADDDANWTKAAITGCVYPTRGDVFIKRGKAFHPPAAALGKKTKAAPQATCRAAATQLSAR